MKLTIHNVGHGLCVSLVHKNGNVMLWDCGSDDSNRPSEFLPDLGIDKVDRFFVTNYDEDHISDLPSLRSNLNVSTLHRNKSISADQLRIIKRQSGPVSIAMESMIDMINSYTSGQPEPPPPFPGVEYNIFWNKYGSEHYDTNNISLVTFLDLNSTRFIIPGDLELPGWRTLLQNEDFRSYLADVDIFIAPHHGRESGYCPEVFELCHPAVIVFSDSSIQYATQKMSGTYGKHASGVNFNGESRSVLSTRKDGSLTWTIK